MNSILIVDDEKIQRKIIRYSLEKNIPIPPPLCVLEAEDGNEAVKKTLNSKDLKIIIMDITMPNCNGLEATQLIRMFNKKVKIFACTAANITSEIELDCKKVGMDGFFNKPFDINSIKILNKYLKQN